MVLIVINENYLKACNCENIFKIQYNLKCVHLLLQGFKFKKSPPFGE